MKKVLIYLTLAILFLGSAFSFTIFDSDGNEKKYFNLSDNSIYIKSQTNLSPSKIEFTHNSIVYEHNFTYNNCSGSFCYNETLNNIITNKNISLSSSINFTVTIGNESKNIYLDIQNPTLIITNATSLPEKKILLEFNYADNYEIDKVELYRIVNGKETFLEDLTDKTTYERTVNKVEEFDFLFKVYDKAQNIVEVQKIVNVPDMFVPKINSIYVKSINSKYSVEFEIEDENLDFYRITQNSLSITEDISGKTYSGVVPYDYEQGSILFKVQDVNGNFVEQTISLKPQIEYEVEEYFTNKKRFEIESNANKCYLVKFHNKTYNTEFEKDSDNFYIELDIVEDGEHEVEFRCIRNNYEEYLSDKFYYDSTPPQKPFVGIEKLENGHLKITWSKTRDSSNSDIKYYLYKNNQMILIDDGDKLAYTDIDVKYPNSYSYYVEVIDEAENTITTDIKTETPVKTSINFTTNLQKQQKVKNNMFSVSITAEQSANLYIIVKNKGVIIDQQIYENLPSSLKTVKLNLTAGVNEVQIKLTDSYGNIKEENYFITYEEEITNQGVEKPIVEETTIQNTIKEQTNTSINQTKPLSAEELKEKSFWDFWFWIIFFILLLFIFAYFFIFHEPELKRKLIMSRSKKYKNKIVHDAILKRNLTKAKLQRKVKKEEIAKEKELNERKRELSEFEKQKLKDLSSRKERISPFSGQNSSKNNTIYSRRKEENEILEKKSTQKEEKKSFDFPFIKKKEEQKEDPFNNYLHRRKNTASYNDSSEYKQRIELETTKDTKKEEEINKETEKKPDKSHKPINTNTNKPNEESRETDEKENETEQTSKREKKEKFNFGDYLEKRTKKRRFFLKEQEVERELRNRK